MDGSVVREKAVLVHHPELAPEDFAKFLHLPAFMRGWKKLGLTETDLKVLHFTIMSAPQNWPVVPGTGGLRKIRFAPPKWRMGKRGGARVCYVYFREYSVVLLVAVYGKRQKDDLSSEERAAIKACVGRFEKLLEHEEGGIRHGTQKDSGS